MTTSIRATLGIGMLAATAGLAYLAGYAYGARATRRRMAEMRTLEDQMSTYQRGRR